ncbi:NHL domain-containing protein [Neorhodopirellula pilleata]|uniref:Virginiamycin B lyase n=1 Tax=Neorhodopirellula pilleata TaxID=2714738 RepID=A0A5C6AVB8_9BACT|nr:hypothetical protein [Neorhodopirellula pilleata]TWU03913.1 Virginiamycin B lyase [Neorhodopirellula pilleata]
MIRIVVSLVAVFLVLLLDHLVQVEAADLGESFRIETVAGTGLPDNNGASGNALAINVGQPFGVEVGPNGALYVTEVQNHRVMRIDLHSGDLSVVAGCGRKGYSGDGGSALQAELNEPYEVRFDQDGNMFFVEMQNHLVRRVDAKTGVISTIAGTGVSGYNGDDGVATEIQLNRPHSIALDDRDGLYIADIGNHRIRRVDLRSGSVKTIAGNGGKKLPVDQATALGKPVVGPRALTIDDDSLWVALREGHSIWKLSLTDGKWTHVAGTGKQGFSGDGGPAKAATFNGPKGIAITVDGKVFVVDTENQAIRMIDQRSGNIWTIAGSGPTGRGMKGDGGPATAAHMDRPHGICAGSEGSVFIGDTNNHRVRRIHPAP